MTYKLIHGDCFDEMANFKSGSFDLILTDPPYGTMKGCAIDSWAKRSEELTWDDALPPEKIFASCVRILRENGKLILFSQEPYTSELVKAQSAFLPFSYKAIWLKSTPGNSLMAKSAMVSYFEDILIFQKVHDYELLNPLRTYFKSLFEFIGAKSIEDINSKLGDETAKHCFTGSFQFCLCTAETYQRLISIFGIDKMDGFMTYGELKRINKASESRFNLWQGKGSKSNVLAYPKDSDGSHPTQKPVMLLEDLVKTFSNEGDNVLDFTMGSGSTGVACRNCGRNFVGIEKDDGYFAIATDRLNGIDKKGQTDLFLTDFEKERKI